VEEIASLFALLTTYYLGDQIKNNEMGWACDMSKKNACRIWARKPEEMTIRKTHV
jgi:hypothetical protein